MFKKLIILSLAVVFCLGCKKKQQIGGCSTGTCTTTFASVGIYFNDKNGVPTAVEGFSATNQRTKENVLPAKSETDTKSYYIITDDSQISKFSSEGDEVLVTAINPSTGQSVSTTYRISGGCKCHVEKIYGVTTVPFD
jgi:uncharacterized lipoprotein NlpE involved in copper resistance